VPTPRRTATSAHAVRPKAVDLALLQRLCRGDAKVDTCALRARHRRDPDPIAREVEAGRDQELPQAEVNPRRRADAATLDHVKLAAARAQILVHDQEPVHALRLRAEELHALPLRKRGQRRMRRTADEIDRAVAQRRVGLVNWEDHFERDVEALLLEEAELDRGDRREVGV
jgi:hypothetical protein